MKTSKRSVLAIIAIGGSLFSPGSRADDTMWVVGSYVNVHETADDKSRVVDHLTTNTQVRLSNNLGRFCAINWGGDRQGYIVCRYLAGRPLSIKDVEQSQESGAEIQIQESPLRAFWIEPDYRRLREAGAYFEKTMLNAAARNKDAAQLHDWKPNFVDNSQSNPRQYFNRFAVPEFEAMKALASKGMLAERLNEPIYLNVAELLRKKDGPPMQKEHFPLLKYLPPVAAARFSASDQVGRMNTTTDWLSALFQIPYKLDVLSKPYAVGPQYNDAFIFGSWDVGDVKLSLIRPVLDVGIYLDGSIRVMETLLEEKDGYYPDYEAFAECGSFTIDAHLRNEATMPYIRTALPTKKLLVYFRTPGAFDINGAKITKTEFKLKLQFRPEAGTDDKPKFAIHEITQYTISLDSDAAPDFTVFELRGPTGGLPGMEGGFDAIARYYFVNVGSEWRMLDSDFLNGCS